MWQTETDYCGSFLALGPTSKTPKMRNLKKWEKLLEISSLYTCILKTTIIWGTAPEIEWDRHNFLPFFALLPHYWPQKLKFEKNVKNAWIYYHFTLAYLKWRSYHVWFLRYKARRSFLSFWAIFLSFYPTNSLKNQNFEKMKQSATRYHHFTPVHLKSWS